MTVRQQDLISRSLILHVTVIMKENVGDCTGSCAKKRFFKVR